jgi:hypothetical protein
LVSSDMRRPVVGEVITAVRHACRAKLDVRVADGSRHIPLVAWPSRYFATILVWRISSTMRCSFGDACETMRSPRPYRPERSMRAGESCSTSIVCPCVATIQASHTLIDRQSRRFSSSSQRVFEGEKISITRFGPLSITRCPMM